MPDYIAQIEGDYYEGTQVKLRLITPQPVILQFSLDNETTHSSPKIIFAEDYFNSGTRIRRGRLYIESNTRSWSPENISPRPVGTSIGPSRVTIANVNESYETYTGQDIKYGSSVVLGDGSAESRWRVVLAERVLSYGLVVTLKAKTFLGVLPEVFPEAIPEKNRQYILQALEAVVESASIQAPQPVIDACRNAASHMISANYPDSNLDGTKDLGRLVTWLIKQEKLEKCTDVADSILYLLEASASHLVNRLHSRAKANGPATHGTRPVSQYDADLAVNAIAFLLQDFGWAENG